jgi:arylamine N-acetyltransferase
LTLEQRLDLLGLAPRAPDLDFLRRIFLAFNERVPFESASKIARRRRPEEPDFFWREHEELGTGGTCFARVAAFEALVRDAGFCLDRVLGRVEAPADHAALVGRLDGRLWLVDAGFPLPDLLPIEAGEIETFLGTLAVDLSGGQARIAFASGPRAGMRVTIDPRPVSEVAFRQAWDRTFEPDAFFRKNLVLLLHGPHRAMRFARGEVQILDAHSRARIPIRGARASRLSDAFGIDAGILEEALAAAGDPEPELSGARIEAYLDTERAEELFDRLATADGYRRFASGLGEVEVTARGSRELEVRIRAQGSAAAIERVRIDPERRVLEIERDGGLPLTGVAVEPGGPPGRLVRYARFPDAREEFLRIDAGRGRIAGLLAMDLLAISRL